MKHSEMESYDLSNLQVLIVDQNHHMLGILRTILVEFGIRKVRDASDPDIAFEIFKEQKPDIIFSDWAPGHDEVKFLNKVRTAKDSPNPYVPIIVVTSYSEQINVVAARDLGMTEFLAAPVSAKSIYNRLCRVIEDKRPFIKEKKFFGPDRRRHKDAAYEEKERRSVPVLNESKNDKSAASSQEDEPPET